jgi:N-acetylglucosaminyl-diphospho-decaprenol L-rhamnosyltransferase
MITGSARDSRVTVVILTHNRRVELLAALERARELPEAPAVVVVDNASHDGTAEHLARGFPDLDVVRLRENRGAAGRNVGAERAATRYVAFADDDTWWAPGSLRRAADLLDRHPQLGLITGRILVGPDNREDAACAAMAGSPLRCEPGLPGMPVLGFLAGATVVRRSAFLSVGGYERRLFLGGEEQLVAVDLAAAGWAMAYVPDVLAHHHPSAARDGSRRRVLLIRNALWFAWLRRPASVAVPVTVRTLRAAAHDPDTRRALREAVMGLGWVLHRRRVTPPHVEDALRRLEAARAANSAVI